MIYLYAESFYYFAHRVQDILGEPKAGLPHVRGFVRCRKVTGIRNHLIEHAYLKNDLELGGQKDVMSLGDGPIIRSNQGDGSRAERDLGMFANARELKEAVHPVLERALNTVGGYVNDGDALAAPLEQAK